MLISVLLLKSLIVTRRLPLALSWRSRQHSSVHCPRFPLAVATHTNICIAVIIRLQLRDHWYRFLVVVSGFGLLACARRVVVVGVWGGPFLCEGLFVGAATSGAAAFCESCHCVLEGEGQGLRDIITEVWSSDCTALGDDAGASVSR